MDKLNIFKALADFQQEVPVIHKDTQGYGYSYADLPAIFEIINPLLKKNGLGFTQLIEGSSIKTIIFHIKSGEYLESLTDIPQGVSLAKMNEFQVLGSAITYLRRYSLSSILGIITDKDTDASGSQKDNAPISKNSVAIPADVLKEISNKLEATKTNEDLKDLYAKEISTVNRYPAIKAMFTNKKTAINAN